ncbi:MAG: hypothetical protein IJA87_02660 [Clostridia bacterium]|nr:hypothetical protein [Clostridia bacterium]
MKKLLSAFLAVCLLFSVVAVGMSVSAEENTIAFAGGNGTAENPYKISTTAHLNNVRYYLDSHFILINDIVFTSEDYLSGGLFYSLPHFVPIGDSANPFTGTFDGNNFVIDNLLMRKPDNNSAALFVEIGSTGTVKNLGIVNCDIYVYNEMVGSASAGSSVTVVSEAQAAAFAVTNRGTIENCFSNSVITSTAYASSGIGMASPCAYSYAAGIAINNYGIIRNCYNRSKISSNAYAWMKYITSTTASATSCGIVVNMKGSASVLENCYSINQGETYAVKGKADDSNLTTYPKGTMEPISSNSSGTMRNNYYLDTITSVSRGIALSDEQMKQASSFKGFDFDTIWTMDGDSDYLYPELRGHEHSYTAMGTDATCTVDGVKTYTCYCGDTYTETIPAPGHTWSEEWYTDNEAHWHKCTVEGCGEESEHEQHSGGTATLTDKAICKGCGEAYGKLTAPVIFVAPANDRPYVTYGNRDYIVKVIGSPSKIQVVRDNGGTTTVDRRKATITTDGDTEIWLINIRVEAGTHNMRAKYGKVWHEVSTEFTIAYDIPGAYSFDISYENGIAIFNAVTDPEVIKVQFALDNGCTLTYSQYSSKIGEDGLRYWTVSRKVPADIKYTLRTKYGYTWTDTEFSVKS